MARSGRLMRKAYDPAPPFGLPPRVRFRLSGRALAQHFLLALVWPFLAAVIHVRNYPRYRLLVGFVVFCGFSGLVFIPWPGSDAHTYMLHLEGFRAGLTSLHGEPVPVALMTVVGWIGLESRWYFGLVGLLYGVVVASVAKLLFSDVGRNIKITLVSAFFLAAFFLNHPVFSAINARYHLALWVMVLAALLMLDGRWKQALAVAAFGSMIHFGQVAFAGALVVFWLSRWLGSWQLVFAYVALAIAFVIPPWIFVAIADFVAQVMGSGAFSEKVETHVGHAGRLAEFGYLGERESRAWFLEWFTTPIFWSLLITGHFLAWKIIRKREDPLCQLWVLIILMWALQFAMAGFFEGSSRMQRNTTALLLLFHARWFLVRKDGAQIAVLVNALPFLFYFVVYYRMWLHQASLGAFMPTPFGVWPDLWPTVMGFLGFR